MQYVYSERVTASEGCASADEINRVLERFPEGTLFAVQGDSHRRQFSWILVTMDRKHYDKIVAAEEKAIEAEKKAEERRRAEEAEERRLAEIARLQAGIVALEPDAADAPKSQEEAF